MTEENDERFQRCLDLVLIEEGGFVDDPRDPGGATNMGITRRTLAAWRKVVPWQSLPVSAVKNLSRVDAAAIYRTTYWRAAGADRVPAGLDLALFDFAVHSGVPRPVKALQATLKVSADGVIGPKTLDALKLKIGIVGIATVIDALCDRRVTFLRQLAAAAVFGRGWTARVAAVRQAAQAMAGAPAVPSHERTDGMTALSGYKTYIVAAVMLAVGVAGLIGVDLPSFSGQAPGTLVMEALAVIFLRHGVSTEAKKS